MRQRPGNGGLVLRAELAQLRRRQALRILVQEKQAHYMGALQVEFRHFQGLDALDVLVAYGDTGDKGLKPPVHKNHLRNINWDFSHLLSCIQLFATPWAIQSMEFSRPEYRNR